MKKILSAALAALLLAASAGTAVYAADAPAGDAIKGTPTIDGKIDDVWANAPVYSIDRVKDGRDTGLKSQFSAMWDETALYVLIIAEDSDHSFEGGPSVGDGMEIYLDLNNAKTMTFDDDGQAYFAMCANDAGTLSYDGSAYGKMILEDAASVAMTTEDGRYIYEAKILAEAMEVEFTENMTIGFDIQVNDQVSGETSRSGAYGWSDDINKAWESPEVYGNLTFTAGGAAAAAPAAAAGELVVDPLDAPYGMNVEKTTFAYGEDIMITTWGENTTDWVGIYHAEEDSVPGGGSSSRQWFYCYMSDGEEPWNLMDGEGPYAGAPLDPGKYNLYFCFNDGYEIGKTIEITILEDGETAAAPAASASEPVVIYGVDYKDCGENVNPEFQRSESGMGSIALKPLDAATAATCWWDFDIDVPADGTVKFVVTYAANGDRYMDVTFNGTTQKVTCPSTGDFGVFSTLEVTFENVKAGKQTLRFAAPADFNNDDIKTPNIDYFEMTVTAGAAAAPAAPAAAPAADAAWVTEGLAALYDGANNANGSQDKETSTWKDSSGNGIDFEIDLDDTNYWTDNAFHANSAWCYFDDAIVDVVNGDKFSVEIVFGKFTGYGASFNTFLNSDNDNFAWFIRNDGDYLEFKNAGNDRPKVAGGMDFVNNSTLTITFDLDECEANMYVDGEMIGQTFPASNVGADTMFLAHADASRNWEADVHCIRYYTTVLTPEQIAQNVAADQAKYFTAAPAAAETPAAAEEAPAAADVIEIDAAAAYQDYPNMDLLANNGAGYASLDEAVASLGKTAIAGYTFVSGTEGFANEGPENLWDNDTATKFCTGTYPTTSIAVLDGEYAIDGLIMATANDNAEYNGRSPFEWAVYGSKDGATWTAFAYGDDYFFEETNFTYYAAPVTTADTYKYVMFQSEGGLAGVFQVSEIALTGTKVEAAPAVEEAPVVEEEPVVEETPVEEPAVEEEPVAEEPVVEEEVVEAPAEEAPVEEVTEAAQTFDFGVIAAAAALISAAGYAISKKSR